MEHCGECGFTYADVSREAVPDRLREAGLRFTAALGGRPDPRQRPAPEVWSPLEYACHVRDVLRVQAERVALALAEDEPEFVPMGREERVVEDAYTAQDPRAVATQLAQAADDLAGILGGLTPEQWERTGVYNWPVVQARTLLWLGQHTIHEVEHHLMDVQR
ncbi:DinB family protein [Actinoplanes sp. NBC_00393]|uniref:DinB family protein n=1 Tax=Actinoplanes sp. NBC_00393 TaxID=2975953 RepID=UPI002E1E1445